MTVASRAIDEVKRFMGSFLNRYGARRAASRKLEFVDAENFIVAVQYKPEIMNPGISFGNDGHMHAECVQGAGKRFLLSPPRTELAGKWPHAGPTAIRRRGFFH